MAIGAVLELVLIRDKEPGAHTCIPDSRMWQEPGGSAGLESGVWPRLEPRKNRHSWSCCPLCVVEFLPECLSWRGSTLPVSLTRLWGPECLAEAPVL